MNNVKKFHENYVLDCMNMCISISVENDYKSDVPFEQLDLKRYNMFKK